MDRSYRHEPQWECGGADRAGVLGTECAGKWTGSLGIGLAMAGIAPQLVAIKAPPVPSSPSMVPAGTHGHRDPASASGRPGITRCGRRLIPRDPAGNPLANVYYVADNQGELSRNQSNLSQLDILLTAGETAALSKVAPKAERALRAQPALRKDLANRHQSEIDQFRSAAGRAASSRSVTGL
jgi:hypothetical protein